MGSGLPLDSIHVLLHEFIPCFGTLNTQTLLLYTVLVASLVTTRRFLHMRVGVKITRYRCAISRLRDGIAQSGFWECATQSRDCANCQIARNIYSACISCFVSHELGNLQLMCIMMHAVQLMRLGIGRNTSCMCSGWHLGLYCFTREM